MSGELTTSRGPGTTFGFALALVEQLYGESVAKEVGELLVRFIADLPCNVYLDIFGRHCVTQWIPLDDLSLEMFTAVLHIYYLVNCFSHYNCSLSHETFLFEILKLGHSITKLLELALLCSYVS